mmetsp:Transcript_40366/g.48373  ORF Transcript_40366/g.48373 Transcript_40366/m.48373 type:complete len:104 (-) Transcript_40366:63-374(-)
MTHGTGGQRHFLGKANMVQKLSFVCVLADKNKQNNTLNHTNAHMVSCLYICSLTLSLPFLEIWFHLTDKLNVTHSSNSPLTHSKSFIGSVVPPVSSSSSSKLL